MAETRFKTTTMINVFRKDGNILSMRGTLPASSVFTSDGEQLSFAGKTYIQISGSVTPTFNDIMTGGKTNSSGMYVPDALCVKVNTNSGSDGAPGTVGVTATKNTGERVNLHNVTIGDGKEIYTIKIGYTVVAYRGPDVQQYSSTKVYQAGQQIRVYATCRDDNGNIWASPDAGLSSWVQLKTSSGTLNSAFTTQKTTTAAPTTKESIKTTVESSNGVVTNAKDTTYATMEEAKIVYGRSQTTIDEMTAAANDSAEGLYNMQFVIGIPPKITPTADIQYMTNNGSYSNNFGRCYTEMFMAANTVCSVQPCKVKYLPEFTPAQKQSFWTQALGVSGTAGEDNMDMLTGQLFEAQPDYSTYINSVNMLARAMAIYMNIGDKPYMGTGSLYKSMDYSWYRRKNANRAPGLFGQIGDAIRATIGTGFAGIMNDDTYIHFYATADGTSINENMSVGTRQTSLEALFNNNLAELAQEIQFLGGEDLLDGIGDVVSQIGSSINAASNTGLATMVNNLAQYGGNYLKGGRMVFPQMLDDCRYDRSYTCSCRFISPSGDPEAIFLNCYLPLCYLLPYALPQMLSDNMYTFPHLARVNCKGLFHCDLAAITGLKIQRGGQDGTCWTVDGLPFEVDVSFDITPLYSKLMVTGANHPILFMKNAALHEYLGAMCGVSFLEPNLDTKWDVIKAMGSNTITGAVPSMLRSIYSSDLANWARRLFTF